ncbi:MAG: extracellular solute-binding protein [Pseudolysinimonas sp.]
MIKRPRTIVALTALVAASAMTLTGCAGGGSGSQGPDAKAPTHLSGTISVWNYLSDREAKDFHSVVAGFTKANPDVKVVFHDNQSDDQITKVISSGGDIDVAISSGADDIGAFCGSGAFRDLGPYMKRDNVSPAQFLAIPLAYSAFEGKQCSLPILSDTYGLYYNTALLSAAGYTEPPKTLSELEAMALKLTTYNADGSIKTLGFNPMMGFYENQAAQWSPSTGATWMTGDKSTIAGSPAWTELMTWQKSFVDTIGYAKLKAFTSGLGDEFSANQAFQSGQLAMNFDGEWRVAFIQSQKPDLKYGTAPFPVGDQHSSLYGGGYTAGDIIGISKTSKNPEVAWALTNYLATNTEAIVKFANLLKNIPATKAAAASPDLEMTPQFKTFFDIAQSPSVMSLPNTPIGTANQTVMEHYWEKYQSGSGGDLAAGLKKVDTDINNQIALSAGN